MSENNLLILKELNVTLQLMREGMSPHTCEEDEYYEKLKELENLTLDAISIIVNTNIYI